MILLNVPSSLLFVQNASALASVAQITSAKANSSNLIDGSFANIAQGQNTVKVTFDYRGFDDNVHVLELRAAGMALIMQKVTVLQSQQETLLHSHVRMECQGHTM